MAEAVEVAEKIVSGYTLTLNPEEAGYLLDLLSAHVSGPLTMTTDPLGAIRVALAQAGVKRLLARNINVADRQYAVLTR